MTRRAEVEAAAQILGDLDGLRAVLVGGIGDGSSARVSDDVWAAILGAVDIAEALPKLGPVIAGLDFDGLLTPHSLPQTSIDHVTLVVKIDAAIAGVEAWVDGTLEGQRIAELRRGYAEGLMALHVRAAAVPTGPHTTQVQLVLRGGAIAPDNLDLIGEEVEVALGPDGEYVGSDYSSTTGVLQIYLLGPGLPTMMDAVLPAVERFTGPGSYYESRRVDDPASAPPARVDL